MMSGIETTVVLTISAALLLVSGEGALGAPTASRSSCTVGRVGTITSGVMAALTEKAYDQAVHDAATDDKRAFDRLMKSGRFLYLDKGTRVLLIYLDFTHLEGRVTSDPLNPKVDHRVVWIDCSWLS